MFEGEKFITRTTEGGDEAVRIKKILQIELAKRAGVNLLEWIEKNSAKFKEIFHRKIVENPHLDWDAQNISEGILTQFEDELNSAENIEADAEKFEEAA